MLACAGARIYGEKRIRLSGVLLKESLTDDGVLDFIQIVSTELWEVRGAVAPQPGWWTVIRFEADTQRAEEIAQRFSKALKPTSWYIHFSTDIDTYVIFPERVFRYPKGNQAARAEATAHALSLGIPRSQLDWKE